MMYLMDVFHKYRWLVIPVERPKASAVKMAVDSGSQQPPPPPPNLAELMAMQTELPAGARAAESATPAAAWRT